ncbi:MAG: PQQ-binding-like beta-propeller repeat protein [Nevskia sp.]|nr:PQQ-binding-like beta-propeller repeat protein [Nevskia sp.]
MTRRRAAANFTRLALLALLAAAAPARPDDSRVAHAERDQDNWLTYGHGFANQRYSELRQIDTSNVAHLAPAWIFQTGVVGTFPTNPLVVDGVMYLTTPFNHVIALDAATGALKWRYTHKLGTDKLCCGSHNRGLAWSDGRLFMITADARLLALDAASGKVLWDIPVADPTTGDPADLAAIGQYDPAHHEAFDRATRFAGNMAPLVYDGMVFVGVSGTGYSAVLGDAEKSGASELGKPGVRDGLRAFLTAYSVADGRLVWRWYSTASKGWEGGFVDKTAFGDPLPRDTAAERASAAQYRDAWKTGGGSIFSTPSIDAEHGLIYFGTGNASPGYQDYKRPGDNLYTSSVVALDIASGALRWYHQIVPHDLWGYDMSSPPLLLDLPGSGREPLPVLAAASKSGWMYVINRLTGAPIRRSQAFVPQDQTMFRRATAEGIDVLPGAAGGANWPPSAYSPQTGWVYVPATDGSTHYQLQKDAQGKPVTVMSFRDDVPRSGTLTAIDPADGTLKWQLKTDLPMVSGALATAGGLVFAGESNGDFDAVDARSGKRLWRFATGAGVNAPPITYRINGRQYVAVAAGGHALFKFPLGDAVIAFALPE